MYSNASKINIRIRDNRHTYTVLRIGLGLPQQTHINPKLKEKGKGASLVASWAGPLAWAESWQDGCAPWRPYTLGRRRGCSLDEARRDWSATRVHRTPSQTRGPAQKKRTALVRDNEPPSQTQEEQPPTAPRARPQLEESKAA